MTDQIENESTEATEASSTEATGATALTEASAANTDTGSDEASQTENSTEEVSEEASQEASEDQSSNGVDYEALTLPDDMPLDEAALDAFKPLAEKYELGQEAVQDMVSLYAKFQQEAVASTTELIQSQAAEWVDAIKSEWGKSFDTNVSVAAKAVELGGDELRQALDQTGAGNHPAIIKFFYQVGKSMGEDNFMAGEGNVSQKKTLAEKLYPNMVKSAQ